MADGSDLLELARRVAGAASDHEQIEAYVARSRETEVRVFDADVESLSVAGVDGVGVRVVVAGRQGYAWAGSLDPEVVDDTLAEARDNAAFGEPDEWNGLATPEEAARGVEPAALDVWREELLDAGTDEKVAIALELECATRAADERVRGVEHAGYGDSAVEAAVANSLGLESVTRRTLCSCSALALAGDEAATQTGSGFSAGRTVADLDVGEAAADAAERAVRLLGAAQPPSRRLPVVLDPLVTRSLLGILGAALGGEAVLKGRSMFAGREGEEVAAATVTLVDDPTTPDAFGAVSHDSEGVPTRRVELIAGGRLAGFLHNVYTGRRSGTATTGSAARGGFKSAPAVAARALHLVPGDCTPEEILASVPEALYVQSVSGLHSGTNPVSGDFSVGVEGLMVRGGAFAEPVREVTIASTLQRMLLDVHQVGSDLTWLPGGAAGMTLLVGEMTRGGA
ncbi:MAG TPA: TldD/PmbA family protein [Acidimicrobiia bacterium]